MKKTCNSCRALNINGTCDLKYKTKVIRSYNDINTAYAPLEECPKPKTISRYIELYNTRLKERHNKQKE